MERGATSNSVFIFPQTVNFGEIEAVELRVTGEESGERLVKRNDEISFTDEHVMSVFFSQEDTLSFWDNEKLLLQWRWRNRDGTVRTSRVIVTDIYEFLGDEVI